MKVELRVSLPDDSVTTVAVLKSERTDVVLEVKKKIITPNPKQHSCNGSICTTAVLPCYQLFSPGRLLIEHVKGRKM